MCRLDVGVGNSRSGGGLGSLEDAHVCGRPRCGLGAAAQRGSASRTLRWTRDQSPPGRCPEANPRRRSRRAGVLHDELRDPVTDAHRERLARVEVDQVDQDLAPVAGVDRPGALTTVMPCRAARPERGWTSPTEPGGSATAIPVGPGPAPRARASRRDAGQVGTGVALGAVRRNDRVRVQSVDCVRNAAAAVTAVCCCVERAAVRRRTPGRSARRLLARELAAVVHQEAAGAGELVGLARQHPHRQLFA